MLTLYKKELNYYLNNPVGYLAIILFAVFANFFFVKDIFVVGSANLRPFFGIVPWLLLVFIPALAMRIISEEKRTNTMEILLTLPISETQIVIAKFLALLTLVIIGCGLTLGLPFFLLFVTKIYLPEILIGYLGLILVSGSFIAISMFFSQMTKNQVIAFLFAAITLFFLLVLSSDFLGSMIPRFIQDAFVTIAPIPHLQNFVNGVIDLRSVFYFISVSAAFLFLTVIDLEKRN